MSKETITKIHREKGFDYSVDKDGNVIKSSYNWFKDKTTLVVIALLILGSLYYMEMSRSRTNADNFEEYCSIYYPLKADFMREYPSIAPTYEEVIKYGEERALRDLDPYSQNG